MSDSFSKKEVQQAEEINEVNQGSNIGLDQDEQTMNGMYGMAETKEEDHLPSKTKATY